MLAFDLDDFNHAVTWFAVVTHLELPDGQASSCARLWPIHE